MSGVAMLKVRGAKRVFDEMAVDLPVPPNSCSPARFPLRPLKRGRCNPSQPSAPTSSTSAIAPLVTPSRTAVTSSKPPALPPPTQNPTSTSQSTSSSHGSGANNSSSPAQRLSEDELAALARHVPRRLKRVVERMSAGQIGTTDRVFTVNDIREIISSVLAERESKLSEEFARVLHERLAEQFRDFTKFNEDYVARQLRGRDLAYLS